MAPLGILWVSTMAGRHVPTSCLTSCSAASHCCLFEKYIYFTLAVTTSGHTGNCCEVVFYLFLHMMCVCVGGGGTLI